MLKQAEQSNALVTLEMNLCVLQSRMQSDDYKHLMTKKQATALQPD